jgi:hypothetical protein
LLDYLPHALAADAVLLADSPQRHASGYLGSNFLVTCEIFAGIDFGAFSRHVLSRQ